MLRRDFTLEHWLHVSDTAYQIGNSQAINVSSGCRDEPSRLHDCLRVMIGRILGQLAGRGRKVPREGLLVLNSKRGPRNFYKGKGVKNTGKTGNKGERLLGVRMNGPLAGSRLHCPQPQSSASNEDAEKD